MIEPGEFVVIKCVAIVALYMYLTMNVLLLNAIIGIDVTKNNVII